MIVQRISISPRTYYSPPSAENPMIAKITIKGQQNETELALDPEMSQRILAIVADEFAASARRIAENMVAEVITATALPAPVIEAVEDPF